MQRLFLVLVFFCSLLLKASLAASVDQDSSATVGIEDSTVTADARQVEADTDAQAIPPAAIRATKTAPEVAYASSEDASTVLKSKSYETNKTPTIAIIPMVGGAGYAGDWSSHVTNNYTFGLIFEFPVMSQLSIETEGTYGNYRVGYGTPYIPGPYGLYRWQHNFNQYTFGANLKLYVVKSVIRPYIGAGLLGMYYENMDHGPQYPAPYDQMIGAAQFIVGADVPVTSALAIGARGAWVLPLFNRPPEAFDRLIPNASDPRYADAALMSASVIKVMGTVSVSF